MKSNHAPRSTAKATFTVGYHTEVIVRWQDAEGLKELVFPSDLPIGVRIAAMQWPNDDWGEIWAQNPGEEPFLVCSAHPADRVEARNAVLDTRRLGEVNHG